MTLQPYIINQQLFNYTTHFINRAALYTILETVLHTLSLNGRSCLLRAICETQEEPLYGHGFIGEVLEMLLR